MVDPNRLQLATPVGLQEVVQRARVDDGLRQRLEHRFGRVVRVDPDRVEECGDDGRAFLAGRHAEPSETWQCRHLEPFERDEDPAVGQIAGSDLPEQAVRALT